MTTETKEDIPLVIELIEPEETKVARCLDPMWRYTPANETDIRRTWAKYGWLPNVRRVA